MSNYQQKRNLKMTMQIYLSSSGEKNLALLFQKGADLDLVYWDKEIGKKNMIEFYKSDKTKNTFFIVFFMASF